ncbi:MAG: hypothetical protein ACK5M7_06540 [Draconibacterium sp.]
MKTIILISSIFYIIGLKISNHFDFIKRSTPPADKIIINKTKPVTHEKAIDFNKAEEMAKDTVNGGSSADDKILEKE